MIPILAALAGQGLSLIASAVMAKGQEFVEDKLGVKLDDALSTPQGRIDLQRLQIEREKDLQDFAIAKAEIDLKADAMEQANTANARDMNSRVQESANASTLAKNAAYILDFLIVGATLLLISLLVFKGVPPENKEIVFAMLGSLLTLCGTVVNFHRGSSSNNQKKDGTIAALAQGNK